MSTTPTTTAPAPIVRASNLVKQYGKHRALDGVSFEIQPGRIVGLIGRNGAGKTTALKALLGLTACDGQISVLGRNPMAERVALTREISFIADTGILPKWLRVRNALDYVAAVHPAFERARAEEFLRSTDIRLDSRVRELSKGMVTQLQLALVLAIRARLLVLDEPTLGLDLLYRRRFYDTLVNDYMDDERTILVTTHQVEEIENLLSDVLFIERGRIVLDSSVEALGERYLQVVVNPSQAPAARALKPFYEREIFGRCVMVFDGQSLETLEAFGEVRAPSIADLFVAMMQERPS